MAVFTYKALSGRQDVSGTIAADTPRQARTLLSQRGLIVRDVAKYKDRKRSWRWPFRASTLSASRTTELFRELATLLAVGMPLLEALHTLGQQHRGAMTDAIVLLHDRVSAGASLAAALSEQPRVFDLLAISIVEVGEDAGTLDRSLERLAEFREKSDQLRGKLATAVIYPAIVTVIGLLCSLFLMTFVVPKILQPLVEQNLPLPWPTRIVKGLSDGVIQGWWALALVTAFLFFGLFVLLSSQTGRLRWHRLQLKLPILGDLVRKQIVARVANVLSTLLHSGVPLPRALGLARKSAGNLVLADALLAAEQQISAGQELSVAMDATGVFPPAVVQVFSLGQESGRLEEMLDRLALAYEVQVTVATQRLVALLEPAMIVVLAGFVLFIMLATVLPILEAGNAIQ